MVFDFFSFFCVARKEEDSERKIFISASYIERFRILISCSAS